METKIIKTEEQHQAYLAEVHRLMQAAPLSGSAESERLELLSVLIENYENNKYPVEAPDPIDAITFRMHERNLKQADLTPYFGTRSRVSEVLARKRPLTVQMIRALSIGLGISAETLVGVDQGQVGRHEAEIDWKKFPYKEMTRRGWMDHLMNKESHTPDVLVQRFISNAGIGYGATAFRRTIGGSASSPTTKHALLAWLSRVVQVAREKRNTLEPYRHDAINASFLRELAQLSWYEKGPQLAVEHLEKHGICVVIERHLRGTHLDGAAVMDDDNQPIVALTLRYDRVDNFWFTLLHEVAHVWKHLASDQAFLDDLDATSDDDRQEAEANRIAREAFIPRLIWKRSDAYLAPSKETIVALARELRIHPAIIAGRLRREKQDYRAFTDLLGQGEVRTLFV